jgi:tripartite-type tricarboxylate transporter receptor subunit TctC
MKLPRRQFLRLAAAAAAVPTLPRAVFAQSAAATWPNRVVRLIVGFPPGGGADSAARIAADRLSKIWGQQVVVENKGGAGGNIAHDTAAHASPDGYTMLFSPSSLSIMPMLYTSLGYNPMTDFAMVSTLGRYPNLIVVSKESARKSLKEFIDNAKANPGKLTFATPGIGTTPHLTAELFKKTAGIDLTHVPYRGVAAGAMSDLLSNRIDSMFNTTGSLLQAVRGGQVHALAQSTPQRSALAPELPTFAEAGVPGFDVSSWYGLFAPAKTPPEIVKKMHDDTAKLLDEPDTRKKYENLGIEAASASADEMMAMMKHEVALWGPVIKAANIRGE